MDDDPRISLEQWRAFTAVVDHGGYAKAALALHKSQSSVTYAVQKLESLLGVEAFRIAGRKAELTREGRAPLPSRPLSPERSGRAGAVRTAAFRGRGSGGAPRRRSDLPDLAPARVPRSIGYGFSWLPEERIRKELEAGTLKPLRLREGGERFSELYLIFADREHAGPATLRLAAIIREAVASECKRSEAPSIVSGRRSG